MSVTVAKLLSWEDKVRLIEEGRQALHDGQYIDDAAVDAWLEGLDENPDLPIPVVNSQIPPGQPQPPSRLLTPEGFQAG